MCCELRQQYSHRSYSIHDSLLHSYLLLLKLLGPSMKYLLYIISVYMVTMLTAFQVYVHLATDVIISLQLTNKIGKGMRVMTHMRIITIIATT